MYIDNKHKLNMKQRRTSLKDLADRLGVSIATVSRALRNSHEVGEEMTQKVKRLAKELNYRPNPFAQSLRKEESAGKDPVHAYPSSLEFPMPTFQEQHFQIHSSYCR